MLLEFYQYLFNVHPKLSKSKQAKQKVEDFAIPPSVGRIIDHIALAKQGDNELGSIILSVCLSACLSVVLYALSCLMCLPVITGRIRIIAGVRSIGF